MLSVLSHTGGRADSHVTDGDIVPITPQGDDGGVSEAGGAAPDEPAETAAMKDAEKQMWMDFEVFCKCFKYVKLDKYHSICLCGGLPEFEGNEDRKIEASFSKSVPEKEDLMKKK